MDVSIADDAEERRIERFPYKGVDLPVTDVTIRWLSQAGPEDQPEYGLRLFTVGPGGEIPIHKHFYYQTMYVLSGDLVVQSHDADTDAPTTTREVGADGVVFIPSMEPHSARNPSATTPCRFLCAIANVYDD